MKLETAERGAREVPSAGRVLPLLGATFVVSVAYADPGNFATNFQAGSQFGYRLLWVVAAACAIGMIVQYLSAKLGIVTGQSLPEVCRERYPRWLVIALWLQAEVACVATDIAEFTGTAIALNLLFGVPLLAGGCVAAVVSSVLLLLGPDRHSRFTVLICALLAVVLVSFLYQTLRAGVSPSAAAAGMLPRLGGSDALLLAVGIVGATVMPHVIYLHSASAPGSVRVTPMPGRPGAAWRTDTLLRAQRRYVLIALGLAGAINMLMLVVAAGQLRSPDGLALTLAQASAVLRRVVGPAAAVIFGISLLAAGIASSSVGTYAGQVAMQGFLQRSIPLAARRAATVIPALLVLASGANPTMVLVLSQVVLSFAIPFALVPLVIFTGDRRLMGAYASRTATRLAAVAVTVLVIALNGVLIVTI